MTLQKIDLPHGFKFSGLAAGIKQSMARDLAIFASDENCVAAGVYTQNLVRAASIDWNRNLTPSDQIRAVVVNSGNANACTGEQGDRDNQQIATEVAHCLGTKKEQVLVLSTGIIGHHLPMERITPGIHKLSSRLRTDELGFEMAAQAILTTDSSTKTARRQVDQDGSTVQIAGMAKGAGMIGPQMATLLGVIITNAKLSPESAQIAIQSAVDASFNRISVEGHTSTNDAVILLSNQGTGSVDLGGRLEEFNNQLTSLCIQLARLIPVDGEGASHLITIEVVGAKDDIQADAIARTVANSNLVKTAVAGGDPNWGRIVSAVGYCPGVELSSDNIDLSINGFELFKNGSPVEFDEADVSRSMKAHVETKFSIRVGQGQGEALHWTSDLTVDYVKFNSEYST